MDIQSTLRGIAARAVLPATLLLGSGSAHAQGEDLELVTTDSWWLPENAAAHGVKVDGIFTMIFVITVLVGLAVFGTLIYFLIKYRYQEGRKAVYLHGNHKLEMIWTITPAVILVIMGILSIRAWADIRMAEPAYGEEIIEVEVLAQQFEWHIRYPGMDGKFGTLDDIGTFDKDDPDKSIIRDTIIVPVGKMVRVHLMSRDVLHSFFVPNMRQKLDAVPGLRGTLTFTPTRTGKFDLMCAELCGAQHYAMQGVLYVLSEEDYGAWLSERNAEVREILSYYEDEVDEDWGAVEEAEQEEADEAAIEGWDDAEDEAADPDDGPAIEGWGEPEEEPADDGPVIEGWGDADDADEAPERGKARAAAPDEPVSGVQRRRAEEGEPTADEAGFAAVITSETPKDAIVGRVVFAGGEVQRRTLNPGTDAFCAKAHEVRPLLDESIVTGAGGVLQNVFVEVTGGLPDREWPVPAEPVVLDQKGCRYEPHVFGVMAGQELLIRNSDNTNHNVHGQPKKNRGFNFGQPKAGMRETLTLAVPEDFRIKCDVHAWMSTWCHVVEHPFFAVTDENGTFTIGGLPPGEYEVTYRHETLGEQKVKVRLTEGQAAEADLVTFAQSTRRRR